MEPKTAASLTAGLLARKGLARPAMRRQAVAGLGATLSPRAVSSFDDLGWNDMGDDAETIAPVPTPSPVAKHIAAIQQTLSRREEDRAQAPAPRAKTAPTVRPAVRKIKEKVEAKAPAVSTTKATDRKSAFTLRIDAERHLRLRLLSAVTNRSAQTLLISALDALIAQNPNIDALAADPKSRPGTTA